MQEVDRYEEKKRQVPQHQVAPMQIHHLTLQSTSSSLDMKKCGRQIKKTKKHHHQCRYIFLDVRAICLFFTSDSQLTTVSD